MDAWVEVLQDFPYYERYNCAGELIQLPAEAARFWHAQGFVNLQTRTVRVGKQTIRQDVFLGNVRHRIFNDAGDVVSERRALVT